MSLFKKIFKKPKNLKETSPPIPDLTIIHNQHLVVDDAYTNRLVLCEYIKRKYSHIKTIEASNGQEALISYENCDIIWVDIQMPIMNGIDLTKELRKRDYKGIIIGITGHVDHLTKLECYSAGMNHIIAKPISKENIYHYVDKYMFPSE